jgi:hypothetical protein
LIYLNDGVLDLDLAGGADRNHRERSLQVGDMIEDIAAATVAYVPPVEVLVSNCSVDTSQLNSIAHWMAGDLDNSGRVAMDDAFMLRQILLQHTSQLYEVLASLTDPAALFWRAYD